MIDNHDGSRTGRARWMDRHEGRKFAESREIGGGGWLGGGCGLQGGKIEKQWWVSGGNKVNSFDEVLG